MLVLKLVVLSWKYILGLVFLFLKILAVCLWILLIIIQLSSWEEPHLCYVIVSVWCDYLLSLQLFCSYDVWFVYLCVDLQWNVCNVLDVLWLARSTWLLEIFQKAGLAYYVSSFGDGGLSLAVFPSVSSSNFCCWQCSSFTLLAVCVSVIVTYGFVSMHCCWHRITCNNYSPYVNLIQ